MKCPKCNGSGWDDEHMIKCTNCDNGVVEQTNEEWFIRLSTEDKAYFLNNVADACYYCGQKGISENENCPFGKCRNNPQEIEEWLKGK